MNNKSGLATDNSDEVLEFAQRIMPMLGLLYNDKCSENGAPIWDPIHSVTLTVDAGAWDTVVTLNAVTTADNTG